MHTRVSRRNRRRGCPPYAAVMYRFPDIYILAATSAWHLIKICFVKIGRARIKLIHHEGSPPWRTLDIWPTRSAEFSTRNTAKAGSEKELGDRCAKVANYTRREEEVSFFLRFCQPARILSRVSRRGK